MKRHRWLIKWGLILSLLTAGCWGLSLAYTATYETNTRFGRSVLLLFGEGVFGIGSSPWLRTAGGFSIQPHRSSTFWLPLVQVTSAPFSLEVFIPFWIVFLFFAIPTAVLSWRERLAFPAGTDISGGVVPARSSEQPKLGKAGDERSVATLPVQEKPGYRRMPRPLAAAISLSIGLCLANVMSALVIPCLASFGHSEDWKRDVMYWFYRRGYHPTDAQFNLWMAALDWLPWATWPTAGAASTLLTYLLIRRIRFRIPPGVHPLCSRCEYDLTGNVSGVCPECGQSTKHAQPGRSVWTIQLDQAVLIVSTICLSWLGMMMTHEIGHVIGALASGGNVERVFHDPFSFSSTLFGRNPHPRFVAWAGPMLGVIIPLAAFGIARRVKVPWAYLLRFFAGFCLVANGTYIGAGAFMRVADAHELLLHGASRVTMFIFGLACVTAGLLLWHRLGPDFGLGEARGKVSPVTAYVCLALLVATIGVMAS